MSENGVNRRMSALRRALLGSVFVMSSLLSASAVQAAEAGQGGTAWADSVRRALAGRSAQTVATADSDTNQAHRIFQKGVASWYGGRFHNRRTSSGERFDKGSLTAAHPTAPLGSKLRVVSEDTGRSVVVTINDRGPYSRGRIIDVSKAAAAELGMLNSGIAHVRVEPAPVEVASAPDEGGLANSSLSLQDTAPHTARPLHRARHRR